MMVMGAGNCDWAGIRYVYYFTPTPSAPSGYPQIIRRISHGSRAVRMILEGDGVVSRSSGTKAQGS